MRAMLPTLDDFVAGDALRVVVPAFTVGGADISADGGYTLNLALRGAQTLNLSCLPTAAQSGAWVLEATGAQTAALQSGYYNYAFTVTSTDGKRLTVNVGQLMVKPDITAASAGFDARTTAQIALEQAEAALASFKGSGGRIKTYTIAGRTVTYDTAAELLQVINYWRVRVATEAKSLASAQGKPDMSRLLVRFGAPR